MHVWPNKFCIVVLANGLRDLGPRLQAAIAHTPLRRRLLIHRSRCRSEFRRRLLIHRSRCRSDTRPWSNPRGVVQNHVVCPGRAHSCAFEKSGMNHPGCHAVSACVSSMSHLTDTVASKTDSTATGNRFELAADPVLDVVFLTCVWDLISRI